MLIKTFFLPLTANPSITSSPKLIILTLNQTLNTQKTLYLCPYIKALTSVPHSANLLNLLNLPPISISASVGCGTPSKMSTSSTRVTYSEMLKLFKYIYSLQPCPCKVMLGSIVSRHSINLISRDVLIARTEERVLG